MPPMLYETLKKTALAHIDAYSSPHPWDENAIWELRSPECIHYLHPRDSIPPPFNEPIDQKHHREFMRFFSPIFDACYFEVMDLVVDVEHRAVVARLSAQFDFKAIGDEPAEQGWKADYMWLTVMSESGEKILRVEEYMDQARLLTHAREKAQKYADLQDSI